MTRLISIVAGALALALLGLPASASAQCNCSNASLVGDSVTTQAGSGPVVTKTVSSTAVELPGAGPALGMAGPTPRMDINFTANTIRIDFTQAATYGTNYAFNFASLNPAAPAGCTGTPKIVGITVQTNKTNASYVSSGATFTANTVKIPFGPPSGNIDWQNGEYILVTLKYACDDAGPGNGDGNDDPTEFSGCCPPVVGDKTLIPAMFSQNQMPGENYTQHYGLTFTPPAPFGTQMQLWAPFAINAYAAPGWTGSLIVMWGDMRTDGPAPGTGPVSTAWPPTVADYVAGTSILPPNPPFPSGTVMALWGPSGSPLILSGVFEDAALPKPTANAHMEANNRRYMVGISYYIWEHDKNNVYRLRKLCDGGGVYYTHRDSGIALKQPGTPGDKSLAKPTIESGFAPGAIRAPDIIQPSKELQRFLETRGKSTK